MVRLWLGAYPVGMVCSFLDGIAIVLKFIDKRICLPKRRICVCVSAQQAQHNLLSYTIALTKHSSLNQPTVS